MRKRGIVATRSRAGFRCLPIRLRRHGFRAGCNLVGRLCCDAGRALHAQATALAPDGRASGKQGTPRGAQTRPPPPHSGLLTLGPWMIRILDFMHG